MVGPVSNDKILPQSDARQGVSGSKQAKQEGNAPSQNSASQATGEQASQDRVSVSESARVVSQAAQSGSGNVQTSEQARELLAEIREQLAQAGGNALAAHGGANPSRFSALLEAAPA